MHLKKFQRKELNMVQKALEPTEATENVLLKFFSKVVERILLDRLSRNALDPDFASHKRIDTSLLKMYRS